MQQFAPERHTLDPDPFTRFAAWFDTAKASEPNDPNALTLATTTPEGRPAARIVLLKEWDERGFVFYTNTGSRKSNEIKLNPQVALLFHWKSLKRQIRIEGAALPVSDAQADQYFAGRPRGSKIGAWASAQSRPLADRGVFESAIAEYELKFAGSDVPRPPYWSGWRVDPVYFEFWQDMEFRLHDREVFTRTETGWRIGRLYP